MTWFEIVAAAERVREGVASPAARLPIAAIGWATVDQERARAELDGLLASDPGAPRLGPWKPLDPDASLGASVWARAALDPAGAPALVVLEPDTEGPLAAFLVRFGEGVAVIYLGLDSPATGAGLPRLGHLLRGGPAWGPHIVVMDSVAPGQSP